ncbi:MAG: hypothetical protein Q9204_001004, partial [Flavoplaca sp. TL-2023a]
MGQVGKMSDVSDVPSGTSPPGKHCKIEEHLNTDSQDLSGFSTIITSDNEHKPSTALSTLLENRNLADPSRYDIARQMGPGLESGAPDQTPYRPLLPKYTTSEPSSPNQLPSIWSLRLPEVKPRISSLKMNQMASLVMGMSREQAVKSDEDALRVWNLWMDL